MLSELHIENFILIDSLNIAFHHGLNVLSGETGAGKSILLDALNFATGQKMDRDTIRRGAEKAVVQAVFTLNPQLQESVKTWGIPCSDGILTIHRELFQSGRSTIRINGLVATQNVVESISEILIDFHGQHQHQSLLNNRFHLQLLDGYGESDTAPLKTKLQEIVSEIQTLENQFRDLGNDPQLLIRRKEALDYEIAEMESAQLEVGEDSVLEEQMNALQNTETILRTLQMVVNSFEGEDDGFSALRVLGDGYRKLGGLRGYGSDFITFEEQTGALVESLRELTRELSRKAERTVFDEEAYHHVQERLDVINKLKRKYGHQISDILETLNNAQDERDKLAVGIESLANYETQKKTLINQYRTLALQLREVRNQIASQLEQKLENQLKQLNLPRAKVGIAIEERKDPWDKGIHRDGSDTIEFMISLNSEDSLKPLKNVASGGELSRIMLAFKILFAEVDQIGTLVFDEIDAGISGRTAAIVSEKLIEASTHHQIICISHLPQICAGGDRHFLIEKNLTDDLVSTRVIPIDGENREQEIGRLISGSEITGSATKAASELIAYGKELRKNHALH